MPADTELDPAKSFSSSKPADGTTQKCAYAGRKVVSLKWEKELVWCSETADISGTTSNYPDGETIPIPLTDRGGTKEEVAATQGSVKGNAFRNTWKVVDVLPTRNGSSGYVPRREIDGTADNARTPKALSIGFIVNCPKKDASGVTVSYDRTEPAKPADGDKPAVAEKKTTVSLKCQYALGISNYAVTLFGELKYVRGWGKEILKLGDGTLTGGFALWGATNHWGKKDDATDAWQYWDGTAWKPTPTTWIATNSNHFSLSFYKAGSKWVCRTDSKLQWPDGLSDWPTNVYQGKDNLTDKRLAEWKKNIENKWSDKFDLKRVGCESTKPECCRYETRCEVSFTETDKIAPGVLIIVYENVRSDSTMWALGDDREGLAPHEFGHLLGAPDEYAGVFSTQLGVSDEDGLADGIDSDCIMGQEMTWVKKRHFKGILETMKLIVSQFFGKEYTYEAVPKAATLALPRGTAEEGDPGPSPAVESTEPAPSWNVMGAIVGAVVGGLAGAAAGFLASGGNPLVALAGGVAGAIAGAAIGGFL